MAGRGSRISALSREDLSCFGNLDDDDPDDLLLDDNDVDLCFSDVDTAWQDRMKAALSAALSSGTLTPLLKEELQCKIQLRRLQSGKEEITPDFSVNPAVMSMEEVVKKNKKMQQNRMSAQKSRDRRKSMEEAVQARLERLEKDNKVLLGQAESLRHATNVARQWLRQHYAFPENCIASPDAGPSCGAESIARTATSRHESDSSICSGSSRTASAPSSSSVDSSSPVATSCRRRNSSDSSLSVTSPRRQKTLSSSSTSSVTSPTSTSDFSWSSAASSRHSSADFSAGLSRPLGFSSDDLTPSVSDDLTPSVTHALTVSVTEYLRL